MILNRRARGHPCTRWPRRALTTAAFVMYIYIVERTQIYLTKREAAALTRAAKTTGRTRSQLIREAIEAQYMAPASEDALDVLDRTAGLWADRIETGEAYVERLRGGRLARMYAETETNSGRSGTEPDSDAPAG